MLLEGKRLLITGVLTRGSIAYAVAERAQQEGAEVVLTGFGRTRRMTERAAARLPTPPEVLELDVNSPDDLAALASSLGHVDGALHAIAFAPGDALGGNFMSAPPESAEIAFRTSAYSFKALAEALAPLMGDEGGGQLLVGMDFDASVAWPVYDWMGVAKAALESVSRYLARDLGASRRPREPRLRRADRDAGGRRASRASTGWPACGAPRRRSGGTRPTRRRWPTRSASCCPTWPRGITGEILHVDGGFHAMGAPLSTRVAYRRAVLLAIDVGNTQTHLGMFRDDELLEHWRFATVRFATADELATVVASLLGLRDADAWPTWTRRSCPRSCRRSRTSTSS